MSKKILIIEDEPEIRTVVAIAVENEGEFVAVTASNGADGIRLAQAERPDVILLDLLLPGMDGCEVCRRIKADPDLRSIPVIFLSAQADYREVEKIVQAGGCATLSKPFDPLRLSSQIMEILERNRAE